MSVTGRAVLKALIASFSVYLLPVFTGHIFYLRGWALGAEFFAGKSGREPAWLAADAALAFGLQGLAFALFLWISTWTRAAAGSKCSGCRRPWPANEPESGRVEREFCAPKPFVNPIAALLCRTAEGRKSCRNHGKPPI